MRCVYRPLLRYLSFLFISSSGGIIYAVPSGVGQDVTCRPHHTSVYNASLAQMCIDLDKDNDGQLALEDSASAYGRSPT